MQRIFCLLTIGSIISSIITLLIYNNINVLTLLIVLIVSLILSKSNNICYISITKYYRIEAIIIVYYILSIYSNSIVCTIATSISIYESTLLIVGNRLLTIVCFIDHLYNYISCRYMWSIISNYNIMGIIINTGAMYLILYSTLLVRGNIYII
jgi:hypothetical protein